MYNPYLEDHRDALAARYALGVASDTERGVAERLLSEDRSFGDRVAEYEVLFGDLDESIEPVTPPPGLWERIERSIDALEAAATPDASAWEPLAPGIGRKIMRTNVSAGIEILLFKVAPQASLVLPNDLIARDCLVLDGDIEIDGVYAHGGDLLAALGSGGQGALTSRTGALLYVRAVARPLV